MALLYQASLGTVTQMIPLNFSLTSYLIHPVFRPCMHAHGIHMQMCSDRA